MTRIHFRTRAAYKHALSWLGQCWTGEAISYPNHVINYYRDNALVVVEE